MKLVDEPAISSCGGWCASITTHDLGGQSTPPARLIQSGASTSAVVLDMSQVRFIDAAAVRVILSAHAAAAACGRRLYVDGLRAAGSGVRAPRAGLATVAVAVGIAQRQDTSSDVMRPCTAG